ncbi:LOW QUALITY PROTEIN: transforming growth factor beta activator LRRC33-like [Mytilus galloprovincialis]|uniref:LOW QUALITY PROTEIN: transforming growth factor beta activator LRRC33-like n=1 Tax=Mytilus galloprovincialis TaxID=29158 RepID=UPI003F7C1F12
MSFLPYNICEFQDLVTVNLSDNKIQNLPNISCLLNLDTLDLSKNNITNISSSNFSQLSFLRYLDLSDNVISYLKPGAFNYRPGSLMHIKLKRNRLYSIDITNFYLGYWFYELDYSHNKISEITNKLNWKIFRKDKIVGGGLVKLNANHLTHFPTPEEVGLTDVTQAFKLAFTYAYQIGDNPWHCDCGCIKYIKSVDLASRKFKGFKNNNLSCYSPPQLKGYTPDASKGNSSFYDLFICNITMKNKCPPRCYCFQQPSQKRVVVNLLKLY